MRTLKGYAALAFIFGMLLLVTCPAYFIASWVFGPTIGLAAWVAVIAYALFNREEKAPEPIQDPKPV